MSELFRIRLPRAMYMQKSISFPNTNEAQTSYSALQYNMQCKQVIVSRANYNTYTINTALGSPRSDVKQRGRHKQADTFQQPVGEERFPRPADGLELLDELNGVDGLLIVLDGESGVVGVAV